MSDSDLTRCSFHVVCALGENNNDPKLLALPRLDNNDLEEINGACTKKRGREREAKERESQNRIHQKTGRIFERQLR